MYRQEEAATVDLQKPGMDGTGKTKPEKVISAEEARYLFVGLIVVNSVLHDKIYFFTNLKLRLANSIPSKHDTSTRCWSNVGPPSTTLDQHWVDVSCLLGKKHCINIENMWEIILKLFNSTNKWKHYIWFLSQDFVTYLCNL